MDDVDSLRRALERERLARRAAENALSTRAKANDAAPAPKTVAAFDLDREKVLFLENPVPMSEMDFSHVADLIDTLRRDGQISVRRWIADHPEKLAELVAKTEIESANAALLELLDVPDVDFLRQRVTWFFKGEYYATFAKLLCAIWDGERRFHDETLYFALGRRPVDVQMHVRLPETTDDLRQGLIFSAVDISRRVRSESELTQARVVAEQASEWKSRYVAGVSHQLRAPLNAVLGLAQVLEGSELGDGQRDDVRLLMRSGEQMTAILGDLMDIARIEAGELTVKTEPVKLAEFAGQMERTWRPQAAERGFFVSLRFDGAPSDAARFDPRRLRQVLDNLFANALATVVSGGVSAHVRLDEDRGGPRLRLSFSDTGPGLSESEVDDLWSSKAPSNAERLSRGEPLGLFIAKRLVDAMGGRIQLRSTEGDGATFLIDLPCEAASADEADARSVSDTGFADEFGARPPRVLVCEDNSTSQRVIGAMLDALGAAGEFVSDGRCAVDAVRDRQFDLVLMDVCMPGMDGIEAAKHIRALDGPAAATRIIAVTANAMPEDRARYLEAGMDDMVAKPIDGVALARAISRWTSLPEDDADMSRVA